MGDFRTRKTDIIVLSHFDFDRYCKDHKLNDSNVEKESDFAFISIIGTPEVLEYYLQEPQTYHWFKKNHQNVLNLEFDDVSEDRQFEYKNRYDKSMKLHAYAMTEGQAEQCIKFIEDNLGKTFIIHCRAGMSRSVGVGRFIIDYYEQYNDCKGKEYVDRMYPNVGVTSVLKRIWRNQIENNIENII